MLFRSSVDLLEIAEDAANDLQAAAVQKQVSILATGKHAKINGVRNYLYEMVYNLCDNAIKYNVPAGKVEVVVSSEGQGANITVRDTGIGIPVEYQSRIFERFFRVDKSRSKASGGTGLGLSIVKHIVQYHQAEIELQSVVGGGTTVSVMFPSTLIETINE